MNSLGVGDGAGINIDLSVEFFSKLTNIELSKGSFGIGNFFMPANTKSINKCKELISYNLRANGLQIKLWRKLPTDAEAVNKSSLAEQQDIYQFIILKPDNISCEKFESKLNTSLLSINKTIYYEKIYSGLFPLSLSSKVQVLKGRLNSGEVIRYFKDLSNTDMKISMLFFHTRFSTNTAPATSMAQPFQFIAHNGELNTDKKNRLSEDAIAKCNKSLFLMPEGQSDSSRLDQTVFRRIHEDKLDIVKAIVAMMPPAWENNQPYSDNVKAMLEYFSLYEEKNDGPAALIFSDGNKIGARLDRLGLRPLRSIETDKYIAVMSEAGQIKFPNDKIVSLGRIKAGGMIYYDHNEKKLFKNNEILENLSNELDYKEILEKSIIRINSLQQEKHNIVTYGKEDNTINYYIAYYINHESFKFLLDPMIQNGLEKISAMGYGVATNALYSYEGGISKYFSQRFAQVTNPPLDSLRETDGMTLRVSIGAKPNFTDNKHKQIVLKSPILKKDQLAAIKQQEEIKVISIQCVYNINLYSDTKNENSLKKAIKEISQKIVKKAKENYGLIILSDTAVSKTKAAIPIQLIIAACNQSLIENRARFNSSLIVESGQIISTHDLCTALGFGASAVMPISVYSRITQLYDENEAENRFELYKKAAHKSLLKIMGKFGICTIESYIGGEFFESNFLDTNEGYLKEIFPNINSPVGGAQFRDISNNSKFWHSKSIHFNDQELPKLGLFKERSDSAGHSFGIVSVREFENLTKENISYSNEKEFQKVSLPWIKDDGIDHFDFKRELKLRKLSEDEINSFRMTKKYKDFCLNIYNERNERPVALRDILSLPIDVNDTNNSESFRKLFSKIDVNGSKYISLKNLSLSRIDNKFYSIKIRNAISLKALEAYFNEDFPELCAQINNDCILVRNSDKFQPIFDKFISQKKAIPIDEVQPAHKITRTFASGAMSHGALMLEAHKQVSLGTNMVGAMSNSGEGGESYSRLNSIYSSKIKQVASGRFGIWTGYLADPSVEEIEIKIAQGAKPGEGGQLPAKKVDVQIASARGGTPGIELVSPPPHHDTYSIEDLAQLIHDCKATRAKVIVKLVSSEGIGTIAVGVAKAGADIINVAGNTGGTGAAAVTSLKNTGRSAEIGVAEVHQALTSNRIRDKVLLRASGAHQTGLDVIKSAILGADSFEFGTTALMMIGCVMAKNCNVACPAGLTTNPEIFTGDGRNLAQYYLNVAHEVRDILSWLGFKSLKAIRGKISLLHLIKHKNIVGKLNMRKLLNEEFSKPIKSPIYVEASFRIDDYILDDVKKYIMSNNTDNIIFDGNDFSLTNNDKSVGGQISCDIERLLNYETYPKNKRVLIDDRGRKFLSQDSIIIRTKDSAGQSYGAFCTDGLRFEHTGICNDGVAKSMCGGKIIVNSPSKIRYSRGNNVLVGNFALFGATGGQLFINGEAGDRFGIRNTGALAVVEGVGEYCCEYMINGTIVNLGECGIGFGNGMSGGISYQYDPEGNFKDLYSKDSVKLIYYSDEKYTQSQLDILKTIIEKHHLYTKSETARKIIDNWNTEKAKFIIIMPNALYEQQSSASLLENLSSSEMINELSNFMSKLVIRKFRNSWSKNDNNHTEDSSVFRLNSSEMYELLTNYAILDSSFNLASKKLKNKGYKNNNVLTEQYAKHLILESDFDLVAKIAKDVYSSLELFSKEQLSALLAHKRITDYKNALKIRDIYDIQAPGMTSWIMYNDYINQKILNTIPRWEKSLSINLTHAVFESYKKAV